VFLNTTHEQQTIRTNIGLFLFVQESESTQPVFLFFCFLFLTFSFFFLSACPSTFGPAAQKIRRGTYKA